MEDLYIKGSDSKPTISFKTTGDIKIEGRAMLENAFQFFQPLIIWAQGFSSDEVNIEVNMEYFNTSVSKQLLDLFRAFEANSKNKVINLLWLYEEGDDEILESGEVYEELLPRINFSFKQYAESI